MTPTEQTVFKTCSFRCPEETYKKFKLLCTMEEVSIQGKLSILIEEYVTKTHTAFTPLTTSFDDTRNIQQVSN